MSSEARKLIEQAYNYVFTLPKRAQKVIWIVVATIAALASISAITYWLTRPELSVTVWAMPSTLTDSQRNWMDSASRAIRLDLADGKSTAAESKRALEILKKNLDDASKLKNLSRDEIESIGRMKARIEHYENSSTADEQALKEWHSRMYDAPLSPFSEPDTEKWLIHYSSVLRVTLTNETDKPITGLRVVCNGASRVWRLTLDTDFLSKSESAEWAAQYKVDDSGSHTFLPPLPLLPGKKTVTIEVQGDVRDDTLDVVASQKLSIKVTPIVSFQEAGLIWLIRHPNWSYWEKVVVLPALALLFVFIQILRQIYDMSLRNDLQSEHVRHCASELVSMGFTDEASWLLVRAAHKGEVAPREVILDPNLNGLERNSTFYRYFIKKETYDSLVQGVAE